MSSTGTSSSLLANVWEQLRGNPINWVLVGLLAYMTRAYLHRATPQVPLPRTQRPRVFETFTPQTLVRHDGHHDVALPIYLAVKGKVYDVTPGRSFYGPEGPYGNFAGHDASRGLAKGSFEADMIMPLDQPIDTLADLTDEERQALDDWEGHFANKYDCVGELVEPEELARRTAKASSA